ncbi:MAG TPA: holo-ACP synthase [bacterium]|nr:holo-ACP synthase [bacterium]
MIKGIGVDLVEVERFRRGHHEGGLEFTEEVFTPAEVKYCRSQARYWEHFAARFAAKEAAFKALGAGLAQGMRWKMVEVVREPSGAVSLLFSGRATEMVRSLRITKIHLTLTHNRHSAAAVVVLESRD